MKKTLLLSILAFVLVGCGGGSVSSSLGSNSIIGDMPKIHDEYELNKARLEIKQSELSNIDRLLELDKELKTLKADTKAKLIAHGETLNGNEVPFSMSAALKSSPDYFYTIEGPLKITYSPDRYYGLSVLAPAVSTIALKLGATDRYNYVAYVKMVNSKGEALSCSMSYPLIDLSSGQYPAGTKLNTWDISLSIISLTPLWADFSELVFCTKDEFKSAEAEISQHFNDKK